MKLELSVQEIQALHTSFLTLLNGKLSISMWSKIFDILESLERELVGIQAKEKNLREQISKQYPEEKELSEEDIKKRNQEFQEGMKLIFEKTAEINIPEIITIDEIKNIKGIDISGRDFMNIRSFCDILNTKKEEVEKSQENDN
jgi:hypothetical protein